jgi:phage portal protein BeeE
MMGWLDLLTKRAPQRSVDDEPVSPVFVFAGQPVRFLSSAAVMTADAAQRRSPQLYRITNFVASAVQSVPWFCEADPDLVAMERAPATKIKAVNDLLKSPNETFTSQQFQYWVALNLMLYARAHFKVGVGATGNPNGLYPLAAKYMRGVLNNRGTVDVYEYGQGVDNLTKLPTRRTAEKTGHSTAYAAEISFPSLTGLVEYNKAPAAIESLAVPLSIVQALMQRALDTASGHPNIRYVITAEKTLTKQQKDALQVYLDEAGTAGENSGNILFLYNTDIKVHKLDNELSDIHSKLPLDDMTRQIAGVFGVPVPLLGLGSSDAAKFTGNYAESRLAFWQDTVVPCYLSPIAAGMTQAICPPGARIKFDLDCIPALWQGRADLGKTLSFVTFLTTNEKRSVLDFEPTTEIPAVILAPNAVPKESVTPVPETDPVPDPTPAPVPQKQFAELRAVNGRPA